MSKHPHSGGDGGPGESPTERLLREALAARADLISVQDLRPGEPPSRRVRRLRPVYIAAVPLFGLAAATAFALLGFRGDNVAGQDEVPPAATLSADPSPTASAGPTSGASLSASVRSADASPPAAPGGPASATAIPIGGGSLSVPYTFRGVKFKVPAGWTVPAQDPSLVGLCVLSPGAPAGAGAGAGDCAPYGVLLTAYNTPDEVGHAVWPSMADLGSDSGWSHQPYCAAWGNPHAITAADSYKLVGQPARSRDIVAGEAIRKTQWQVSCNAKESFTAQLWGLQNDQVLISAVGLKADYQAGLVSILDTIDLTGRQAPLLKPHQRDIEATVDGPAPGQSVPNDGTVVPLSVTYRNTSQTSYAAVQPLLFAESYAGSPDNPTATVAGTAERQDGTAWKEVGLGVGGDMGYAVADKDALFPLAPGQSRTVKYRVKLTSLDRAGVLPLTVQAVLPYYGTGELTVLGEKSTPVRVVVK